jgi:predicted murein hydrolase (TIGR00659 family)
MSHDSLSALWVYLAASPLAALTATLVAYQAGLWLHARAGRSALVNPVLVAVLALVGLLKLTGASYRQFFEGAQFVHFLLGPATVALAVPLHAQLEHVRRSAPALALALVVGSVTAAGSALAVGWALGASRATIASLAPKSVTTPVAMALAETLGGVPALAAVLVILTGIVGASMGPLVLDLVRARDPRARGFALGIASHGLGTAEAVRRNPVAGAFAGLAMGLNALATAILLPLLWRLAT